jgi:AcrR family transcriptional regulator
VSPRRAHAVREHPDDPATALRSHLIEVTEALLAERPPTALKTREIARAAGVSDGVLYNYFADKDELVLAGMTRRFSSLLDRFRSSIPEPGSGTVAENLTTIARAGLELHLETLPIVAGVLADGELLRRFVHEIHRAPVGAVEIVLSIERYLETERAGGRVGDVDSRAAADLLMGAVAVKAFTTLLGVGRSEAVAGLDAVVATLVAGLGPRP